MADGDSIVELWEEIFSSVILVVLTPQVKLSSLFCDKLVLVMPTVEKAKVDVAPWSFRVDGLNNVIDLSLSLSMPTPNDVGPVVVNSEESLSP